MSPAKIYDKDDCSSSHLIDPPVVNLNIGDENSNLQTITASDVLPLAMFSRRAIIDFGSTTIVDRPLIKFLLIENSAEEEQFVNWLIH